MYEVYEQQQRFLKINFPACVVALGQYSGLLGDRKEYAYALEIDTINLFCELNDFYLMSVGELLYNQAWDIYESDHIKNKKQYQKKFLCAQQFAYFNQDQDCIHFLKVREEKYLK